MEIINGEKYYSQKEFSIFLKKVAEKTKIDFKKELEELDSLFVN